MLRLFSRATITRHRISSFRCRRAFSSPSSSARTTENPTEVLKQSKNDQQIPAPIVHLPTVPAAPLSSPRFSRTAILSATLISSVALISVYVNKDADHISINDIYANLEQAVEKSNDSFNKIVNRMKQTGKAASVLWKSLVSVLYSANYEVRSGFELRVAALLADIAAANESRRTALVAAGGGAVIDWLMETVVRENSETQAESARALAYLIADPNVCGAVFERPHAVPSLLRFIFSTQPSKKVTLSNIEIIA